MRRALPMALRVWRRWPLQGVAVHGIVGAVSVVAGAAVLIAWRRSPGTGMAWFIVWLVVLLAQAFPWHWRLRTLCLIWASPAVAELRATPDAPWHVFRAIANRLRPSRADAAAGPGLASASIRARIATPPVARLRQGHTAVERSSGSLVKP